MDENYKLVRPVDPAKCRPKIREKFAKLTLSSNKKKQEDIEERQQQVRKSAKEANVSRNILSDLLTDDDESDGEKKKGNRILRTDSSPSDGYIAPRRQTLNSTDATHCSQVEQDPEKSLEMEPLRVSVLENTERQTEFDDVIETLSSRVSSLAMVAAPPVEQIFLSDVSQIVSTESQKICGGQRFSDLLRRKCKKEPDVTLLISSASSDGSGSVISISDSSEDEHIVNVSNSLASATAISQTSAIAKADRMAAFLRDVRRNYGLPVDSPNADYESRQRIIATADTEPMTMDNDSRSCGTAAGIAAADTESMTPEKDTTKQYMEQTPKNASERRLALNDTEDMTMLSETIQSSPHYAPVMNVGSKHLDESLHESRGSIPDDSLTIAETSEEEEADQSKEEPQAQGSLRPSVSLSQQRSKQSSVSSENDSNFQINISAKINIKIKVSQQIEDSSSTEDSDTTDPSAGKSNDQSVSSSSHGDEGPKSSAQKAKSQVNAIEDVPHSPPERDVSLMLPEPVHKSPDGFMESAQRLLNELYGNSWKTPKVLRSLKKTAVPSRRRVISKLPEEDTVPLAKYSPIKPELEQKNESALDDFSIFRRNIPQDLDSTRLPTSPCSTFKEPIIKLPPARRVLRGEKVSEDTAPMKTQQGQLIKTKSGREVRTKWRSIADSDIESEGENASDQSWNNSNSEEENKKPPPRPKNRGKRKVNLTASKNDNELVYLDLSKDEVEVQKNISLSPPANNDAKFTQRLDDILKSCKFKDKAKIECTPDGGGKTKRKLFTAQLNENEESPVFDSPRERIQNIDNDDDCVSLSGALMPAKFEPFNKYLESVKLGKPIFKIQTPKSQREAPSPAVPKTPRSATKELRIIGDLSATPKDKYGFLKSLDLCVGKSLAHPDALYYRDNFRLKKDELTTKLYEIYNEKCFDGKLNVPINWNKKLTHTAGRCMNKKRLGERTCAIELSEKVLTSADRLRCTLIHELCHAATWIFNGEGGHGATWKSWARRATQVFPELPKIGVCHQYDIEYKYTYKCTLCAAKSHAHSKSKKVENIRCSYCHGAIEVYLNKKDKDGNILATPVKEPTGFAKFVKDKYKEFKRPELKHADVMKLLSSEFASMKVDGRA